MAIFEPIVGGLVQAGVGGLNNIFSAQREQEAREANYKYNELAAQNADARTRALYNDFYSPEALMRQYKKAGLSPSLMFGGTPGQGGTPGAQGAGVNQPSTYAPISIVEGAQAALMAAQAENVKADTANKKEENKGIWLENQLKDINVKLQSMLKDTTEGKWLVNTLTYTDPETGELMPISLYDIADVATDFDDFMNKIRSFNYSEEDKRTLHSEAAQEELRNIYKVQRTFSKEIRRVILDVDKLETEKNISDQDLKQAEFQTKVVNALEAAGYPNMNAEATIALLKKQVADSELSATQKEAWLRLINKMGSGTMTDIIIVLLSVLQSNTSGSISLGFQHKK